MVARYEYHLVSRLPSACNKGKRKEEYNPKETSGFFVPKKQTIKTEYRLRSIIFAPQERTNMSAEAAVMTTNWLDDFKAITKMRLALSVVFSSIAGYFLAADTVNYNDLVLLSLEDIA